MLAEPTVWTYWEGRCPDYIGLCLESLRRWCGARILDRASFDELWTHDRDLPIDDLYVVHRADFIRAYLLSHYGGVWIDADCIVLRPIAALAALLSRYDLVTYREPLGTISNNFLMANPHTPVIRAFYQAVTDHIRNGRPIQWLEIGSIPLTAAIEAHPGSTHFLPTDEIMPIPWTETARFLDVVSLEPSSEEKDGESASLLRPGAVCYMLSNNSMPAWIKTASGSEILRAPTLLSRLFHIALEEEKTEVNLAPNYLYWRQFGAGWMSEYDRRKTRHPYYHIAEMMIADHVAHHAPCRVMEWGCGTGRQLVNLSQIAGVEVFGFDQSQAMINAALSWAPADWWASHLAPGEPTGRLPYPDGQFDIVFTSEALLHTRPDDLKSRLAEMIRVCQGHILHIESPPGWRGYSPSCNGCWGHDLVAAYRELGHECELLPSGTCRQSPYRVILQRESLRWSWSPVMLSLYRRLEAQLEEGFARAGAPAYA